MGRVKDIPGLRIIGCGKMVTKKRVVGGLENQAKQRDHGKRRWNQYYETVANTTNIMAMRF